MKKIACLFFLVFLVVVHCSPVWGDSVTRYLSPLDYGLSSAETGVDRYNIILKTHREALKQNCAVTYAGISAIDMEIPGEAVSIPLAMYNDFAGVVFNVKNDSIEFFLFSKENQAASVTVGKRMIDEGDFRTISELSSGKKLLVVEDQNKWVKNRKGYSYGHFRKDIVLINNGVAGNKPVMPYNNSQSDPLCTFYEVDAGAFELRNIILNRREESTRKTYLVNIVGMDDVKLNNVKVITPESNLTSDSAIRIYDCTNVSFKDVTIDGTYSKKDRSGYGILMNNIWNHTVDNLVGKGNWGIYGTNNVNTVLIKNSDINRFDIHCYGRDIRFENTIFRNLYNQFSSVFGVISFSSCRFIDFTPVLIEYSYNTYTPYNLILKNCVWDVTPLHYYMVYAGFVDDSENTRPELVEKCWPDVRIDGLKVNVSKGVPDVYMFFPRGTVSKTCRISHISKININNLKMSCDDAGSETAFKLTPVDIPVKNDVVIQERRSNVKLKSTFVKR